jgi:hypothetical protein
MKRYHYIARVMLDSRLDIVDGDCAPITGSVLAGSLAKAAIVAQVSVDSNWVNALVVSIEIGGLD